MGGDGLQLFIDSFSVTDRNDGNDNYVIGNLVDDTIIADTNTEGLFAF